MKEWELRTMIPGRGMITVPGKSEEIGWITFRDPKDSDEVILRITEARASEIAGWNSHRQRGLNMVLSYRESFSGVEAESTYAPPRQCPHCKAPIVDIGDEFLHSIPYCQKWRANGGM